MSDKVIEWAREAGCGYQEGKAYLSFTPEELARFATLARADMKEQCANVCDVESEFSGAGGKKDASASNCATAIRALKDQP